jgi:hypothetical protein
VNITKNRDSDVKNRAQTQARMASEGFERLSWRQLSEVDVYGVQNSFS